MRCGPDRSRRVRLNRTTASDGVPATKRSHLPPPHDRVRRSSFVYGLVNREHGHGLPERSRTLHAHPDAITLDPSGRTRPDAESGDERLGAGDASPPMTKLASHMRAISTARPAIGSRWCVLDLALGTITWTTHAPRWL